MNVCIPTLNSIDTFWKCVESINKSSIGCTIYVIDNGNHVKQSVENMVLHKPISNMGVAGSWNWFIDNVPAPRIITNDDIVFDQYAIEIMLKAQDENISLICPENLESHFSCFLLSDELVAKVGKFDEWISPRYAYFEDNDYCYRMSLSGVRIMKAIGAFVEHVGSSTIKHFDKIKEKAHHDKFRLARDHYEKKWGGHPGDEKFTRPFNK